jgi:hypothetical protein
LTIDEDLGKVRVLCRFTLEKRSHFCHSAIPTAESVNSLLAYCGRLFFIYDDNPSPSAQALNLIESAEDEQIIAIAHLKQVQPESKEPAEFFAARDSDTRDHYVG